MKKNRLKKALSILFSVVMAQEIVATTTATTFAVEMETVESRTLSGVSMSSSGYRGGYEYLSNEDWKYRKYSDHICITKYLGTDSEVVVPSTIDNLPVTVVYDTFGTLTGIKKVTLPEGLKEITGWAFFLCEDLEEVNIPSTVNIIGSQAFQGCKNLKSDLIIPSSVSTLEQETFSEVYSVPSILVPDSVTSVDKYTFQYSDGPVVYYSSNNTAMKEFAEKYGGTDYLSKYAELALDKTSLKFEVGEEYTLTSNLNSEDVIKNVLGVQVMKM